MSVNINYLFTRVTVFVLTIVLPTVLTKVQILAPSTTRNCSVILEKNNSALYNNVTANGNSKGAPCVFPFFYNGSYYDDCVSFDRPNLWCSTTANYTRDGQWGECLDYDVCQYHNTLSDPWRNIGLGSRIPWQMPDLILQEGWYLCNPVTGSAQILDCGAGRSLYYLVPIGGAYRTRHSSCKASSCGSKIKCDNSDGSCGCGSENYFLEIKYDLFQCTDGSKHLKYTLVELQNIHSYDDTGNLKGKKSIIMLPAGSAILHNTTNMQLSSPFNIILQDSAEVGSKNSLYCLTWEYNKLMDGSCRIIPIDSSHSVCSCVYQEITGQRGFTGEHLDILIMVVMPMGLLFLSLTLLTFVLIRGQLKVSNTAQVNLCISLLLAHLLFLFKGGLLKYISTNQVACAVLAGLLHFFFLSSFVWMFIDAVLLFITARNLTKIRSRQKEMLGWKYLTVIGYAVPLIVVGVSVAVVPDGYRSEECWLNNNRGFYWSFLGPVYFILAVRLFFKANVILFIAIFITVTFSLKRLNSEILQMTQTQADRKLIRSVLFKTMAQFFILGCPWILGLSIHSSIVLEIIFVILISQQGTVIFLVHCVLNQEIRQQYRKCLCTCCPCKKASTIKDDQMTEATDPSIHAHSA
ncbi:hypothetical protein AOLI_G00235270 [Acnodon oligacanthus]